MSLRPTEEASYPNSHTVPRLAEKSDGGRGAEFAPLGAKSSTATSRKPVISSTPPRMLSQMQGLHLSDANACLL